MSTQDLRRSHKAPFTDEAIDTTMDERTQQVLERVVAGLKIGMIVTIYFSLCVLIILLFVGAGP